MFCIASHCFALAGELASCKTHSHRAAASKLQCVQNRMRWTRTPTGLYTRRNRLSRSLATRAYRRNRTGFYSYRARRELASSRHAWRDEFAKESISATSEASGGSKVLKFELQFAICQIWQNARALDSQMLLNFRNWKTKLNFRNIFSIWKFQKSEFACY